MRFLKDIVTVGSYDIPTPSGKRIRHSFDESRLQDWADTASKMKSAGLRIPAPFAHSEDALPVQVGNDGMLPRADLNAGFWESVWYDDERKTLVGLLDAPGKEDDPNTPAGKIAKSVKDVSIYVRPEFTDGKGQEWKDAIMHIACVTHPIQPDQSNFQPAEDGLAISMAFKTKGKPKAGEKPKPKTPGSSKSAAGKPTRSPPENNDEAEDQATGYGYADDADGKLTNQADPNEVSGSEDLEEQLSGDPISDVLLLLKEVAKIALPEDTTERSLLERLRIALTQKSISEEEEESGGGLNKPPEGAQLRNAPFVMANFTPKQIDAIVQSKVINPDSGKPFTKEELAQDTKPDLELVMSHPQVKQLVNTTSTLLSVLNDQAKVSYKGRIEKLVSTGRAGKEYANSKLLPMAEAIQMSFTPDGKATEQPLDHVLAALEALEPLTASVSMSHAPNGAFEHSNLPYATTSDDSPLSPEQMNTVFTRLKAAGVLAS